MPLNPGGSDDNEGPHCRNCHSGASSCNQCHGVNESKSLAANGAFGVVELTEGKSTFMPNAYAHTSAVAGLSGKCIDGGFSFPHRTLGANMLKDEIFGVDFDGTAIAAGDTRSALADLDYNNYAAGWYQTWESENTTDALRADDIEVGDLAWIESGEQFYADTVENLDSVCIDCHGDSTYWNGDNTDFQNADGGWDLLLKGLP